MAHKFRDYLGTVTEFANQDAGGGERRPEVGLPSTTVTLFSTMVSHLSSIATAIVGTLTVGLPTGASTAANQATHNTKLDSVVAALDPGVGHTGQNTDVDTSSESLGSQAATLGVWVKNISTSSQKVYVNYAADGSATATNGWELAVGEQDFFPCSNASELNVIASAVDAKVCWRTE